MKPIIVVGSGHAGITLIREIRLADSECPLILITKDSANTYYKPNLSKAISMEKSVDQLVMKTKEQLEFDLNIVILNNAFIESIDVSQNAVTAFINGGQKTIAYKDLILAVGASPVKLPIKGDAAKNALYVNTLEDYQIFRKEIKDKKSILVIGAGFVGTEFASDLSSSGYQVNVVDMGKWPLQKSVPEALGKSIRESFPKNLVNWHFETSVSEINKVKDNLEVVLANGKRLIVDAVLSAVGIYPNCELAKEAGIATNRGIVVDEYLRTSVPNVYALGDCAEIFDNTLPFIAPATFSAKALAKTLLGSDCEIGVPNLAVAVKISTLPTIVCPSLTNEGSWKIEGEAGNFIARFISPANRLLGFALTGDATTKKGALLKECPPPQLLMKLTDMAS